MFTNTAYRFVRLLPALILALAFAPLATAATPANVQAALEKAVNGHQRTPAFKKRDKYRHPLQTLEFFGIRPDMTVVEVLPGAGWYTEILAPFLHDHGKLIEALPPETSSNPFIHRMVTRYHHKLQADPAVYGKVSFQAFSLPNYMPLGAPNSVDMVLTFRNFHDLVFSNVHGETTDMMVQRFLHSAWRALKPGGILGIVAHRANPNMPESKSHMLGRSPQHYVIAEAEKAGFKLAGTSEINANPKDPRTHAVWTLPPTLHTHDKAAALAIGEADNMTLKFVKRVQPMH